MRVGTIAAVTSIILTGAADAKPSMRDVPEIENMLFTVAIANEVGKKCDSLEGRWLRGYNMLFKLRNRANKLGYTDSEIREFVESDTEKDRMRAKGYKYLKSKGVVKNNPETFCAYGRAEIAKSSAIGALLKAN